jgi:hypothetical protein
VEVATGSWNPDPHPGIRCGRVHVRGEGTLDETARRLSHEEYAVAVTLAREGHQVRSLPERRGGGRSPDLTACGTGVEVKSWLSPAERGGRVPGPRSVLNKLLDADGQAAAVVLFAGGSGLSPGAARQGLALYAARRRTSGLSSVRVLGDGFDLAWVPGRVLPLDRPATRASWSGRFAPPVPGRDRSRRPPGIGL